MRAGIVLGKVERHARCLTLHLVLPRRPQQAARLACARVGEPDAMMPIIRRWFGLRCALKCCPHEVDRDRPYPGPMRSRCADCGKVST